MCKCECGNDLVDSFCSECPTCEKSRQDAEISDLEAQWFHGFPEVVEVVNLVTEDDIVAEVYDCNVPGDCGNLVEAPSLGCVECLDAAWAEDEDDMVCGCGCQGTEDHGVCGCGLKVVAPGAVCAYCATIAPCECGSHDCFWCAPAVAIYADYCSCGEKGYKTCICVNKSTSTTSDGIPF